MNSQTKDHVRVNDLHNPKHYVTKKGTQLRQLCSECRTIYLWQRKIRRLVYW